MLTYKNNFNKLMNELIFFVKNKKWILLINKKNKYNLYDIGNDFYYKFMFNNKKALKCVMNEIQKYNFINTNKLLIYFIRIWNYYDNQYSYKIGYTDNLSERLLNINQKYNCNWRIIIIMCANIDDKKIEKLIHNKIKNDLLYENKIIGNPINNKPRELYNISWLLYNDFAEIIINMKIKYFESDNYLYESSDFEKIYDKKMNNINLLIDEDNFIYLDQGMNENKYWLYKQKYLFS
jgi:hypothetical protein